MSSDFSEAEVRFLSSLRIMPVLARRFGRKVELDRCYFRGLRKGRVTSQKVLAEIQVHDVGA